MREAGALVGKPVLDRHAAVGEDHLPGRLHVPAHLVLVGAEGKAGRVLRHDQRRNAFRPVLAGPHQRHVDVAVAGAGDELLGAVHHIVRRRRARRASSAPPRRNRSPARSGSSWPAIPSRSASAGSGCAARHCRSGRSSTTAMLWIEMKASKAGAGARQRLEHQHRVEPAKPGTADIVARHRCRRSRAARSRGSRRPGNAGSCPSRAHSARRARRQTPRPSRGWRAGPR